MSTTTIVPRKSEDRGHADHGWLKTFHTFSFADYHDPRYASFGPLRVINEDRVEKNQGFGKHSHREFEIWSYIVHGQLEHRDSLGNLEVMERGHVQMTSTGSGISHSEYNRNQHVDVHFLQIWAVPQTKGLPPSYYTRTFTDEEKRDTLVAVVAPIDSEGVINEREAKGPTPVHARIWMYASILTKSTSLTRTVAPKNSKLYIHLIMTSGYKSPRESTNNKDSASLKINDEVVLVEGDGAFIEFNNTETGPRHVKIESVGDSDAEWLLFEME